MILERRELLRWLGLSAGATCIGGCGASWMVPEERVELALRGPGLESWSQTVCGLCEGGCGMSVRLVDGLPVGVRGNSLHPLNQGGLCPVGQGALEVLYAPGRLQAPLRRGAGGLQETTWEEALAEIGERLAALVGAARADAVVVVSGIPGDPFGDLVERFAAAVGTAHVARLDLPESLPFRLMQGLDRTPGFDLARSDLVLAFGRDVFADGATPLHAVASLIGSRTTEDRATLLHVGTRMSPGIARADQRVVVRPGTHGAFALGVANVLVREARFDRSFVAEHTEGFEDWTDADGRERLGFRRLLLERYYPDRAAQLCGVSPATIVRVARRFSEARAPLAVAGGDALDGSNATWNAMAVHALNALVGAFGRDGGVTPPPSIPLAPLDPTPEPATPSLFAPAEGAPRLGVDPIEALIEAATGGAIEALFVVGANPVFDSPLGERLLEALPAIGTVVAMAPFLDETAAAADFVLPAPVFLEGWQAVSTPPGTAFGSLGLARPAIDPLYDCRHPADLLLELGRACGPDVAAALPWTDYPAYLRYRVEGLARSGAGAVISGSFEESWVHFLEERGWRFQTEGAPADLWNTLVERAGWWSVAPETGGPQRSFRTPSGRFEFFSKTLEQHFRRLGADSGQEPPNGAEAVRRGAAVAGLEASDDEVCLPHFEPLRAAGEGELVLLPYRPLTARGSLAPESPMVLEMFSYPYLSGWETSVELAEDTAHELHLGDGDLVRIESERGAVEAVVRVQVGTAPGVAQVPLGLGRAGGVGSNPLRVVMPAHDDLSGAAARAATRVSLRLIRRRPHGGPPPHGESA